MAKYNEREELLDLVKHLSKYNRCKNCYHLASCDAWVRNVTTLYDDYSYSVENCPYYTPTADVVEVKHGEWISKIFKVTGRKFITCSVCNSPIDSTYTHIDENEFDYCPYCGAKMDKERKDT